MRTLTHKTVFGLGLALLSLGLMPHREAGPGRACWFFHYLHAPTADARPVGWWERVVFSFILSGSEASEPRAPEEQTGVPAA